MSDWIEDVKERFIKNTHEMETFSRMVILDTLTVQLRFVSLVSYME